MSGISQFYPIFDDDPYAKDAGQRRDIEYLKRRPQNLEAEFNIKLFGDTTDVTTGDGVFIFKIPKDCDKRRLARVESYVTTVAASVVTVQVRNTSKTPAPFDLLDVKLTIDAGEKNSKSASTPAEISPDKTAGEWNSQVNWGDQLAIDVDVAGGKGLGVMLTFR